MCDTQSLAFSVRAGISCSWHERRPTGRRFCRFKGAVHPTCLNGPSICQRSHTPEMPRSAESRSPSSYDAERQRARQLFRFREAVASKRSPSSGCVERTVCFDDRGEYAGTRKPGVREFSGADFALVDSVRSGQADPRTTRGVRFVPRHLVNIGPGVRLDLQMHVRREPRARPRARRTAARRAAGLRSGQDPGDDGPSAKPAGDLAPRRRHTELRP